MFDSAKGVVVVANSWPKARRARARIHEHENEYTNTSTTALLNDNVNEMESENVTVKWLLPMLQGHPLWNPSVRSCICALLLDTHTHSYQRGYIKMYQCTTVPSTHTLHFLESAANQQKKKQIKNRKTWRKKTCRACLRITYVIIVYSMINLHVPANYFVVVVVDWRGSRRCFCTMGESWRVV